MREMRVARSAQWLWTRPSSLAMLARESRSSVVKAFWAAGEAPAECISYWPSRLIVFHGTGTILAYLVSPPPVFSGQRSHRCPAPSWRQAPPRTRA